MFCSTCGKDIPFAGTICPYCHRDKSNDQAATVLAFIFGFALAFLGGNLIGVWGAIGGGIVGIILGSAIGHTATTRKPPEVQVTNVGTTTKDEITNEKRLANLKALYNKGWINESDYNKKKKEIIDKL